MTAGVDFDGVSVNRGGNPILKDITFALPRGSSMGVVGPNGSGKTTLLRLIATLIRPAAGRGSVLGHDIFGAAMREVRGKVGLISHTPALIEELTLAENLQHFANLAGANFPDCIKALEVVGLENAADRRAGDSSFGMKRRTEIAWLLVSKPELLLLDEAKSGLDVEARQLVDALVDLTIDRGGISIGVSHVAAELGSQFKTEMRLSGGRLEASS